MLYDKRWEKKVAGDEGISPEIFSLDGLIAWLEKQPADEIYCYTDSGECLAAQFHKACGRQYSFESTPDEVLSLYIDGGHPSWSKHLIELIASGTFGPETFGAALSRARKIAEAR